MKSPKKNGIGEVVTEYGTRVMKVIKKGLLGRSLFDFYGDIKAQAFKTKEMASVPSTPADGKGGVIYTKSADGKLYYKSNEVAEVELSASDTVLTSEQVQDIVGGMLVGTETRIGVTYDDTNGRIDFVVDDMTADTNTQNTTTLSFVDSSDDILLRNTTGGAGSGTDDIKFVAGSNITLTHTDADNITIASTDTNTTYSEATGSAEGLMSIAHHDKLDGIEASADVTDTTNVTAAGALMDSELTDLAGVKGVTISTLQVKPSEGAFANGDKTKLDGIEAGATADQTQADINGLGITAIGIASVTDGDVTITSDGHVTVKLDADNDESNQRFKITDNSDATVFHVQEDGNVLLAGTIITNSSSGNDLTLETDGSLTFTIDRDNNETSQKFSFVNFNAEVANIDESGNLQIDGDLTVDGNNITNNASATNFNISSSRILELQHAGSYDIQLGNSTNADVLRVAGDSEVVTVNGNLTVNGDSVTFESANADDPIFTLKNTSNDTNDAAQMIFIKDRGAAPAVGTNLGEVRFQGEDSGQNPQEYGGFLCEIDVATDGQESGQFSIWVATHDGENQYGLQLTGGDAEDKVNVAIGQGAASVTTIAGTLTMGSTAALDNSGLIQVAAQPNITSLHSSIAITKQVKVTLSTANCNALHTTPIELVAAQGANTVIVPTGGMIRIDRASTQSNSSADVNIHYEDKEPGTISQTSIAHFRRFMYNESGDRVFHIIPAMSYYEVSQNLTDDVNKAVEISVDSAFTTNCFTSIDIYLTYNVFDIS